MEVVEVMASGTKVYNDKVEIVSADFMTLYLVNNIRKLGKRGEALEKDVHRPLIINVVKEQTKKLFQTKFNSDNVVDNVVVDSIPTLNDFGGDMFGNDDFGSGGDMFMSSMAAPVAPVAPAAPTPVKLTTETTASPDTVVVESLEKETIVMDAASSMGSFTFSLDEDF